MSNNNNKRKRKDVYQQANKRQKRGEVDPGQNKQGAIISFDKNKKNSCVKECYCLYEEYAEKLFPEPKEEEEKDFSGDISSAIEAELNALKNEPKDKKKKMTVKDVNCNCLKFIQINLPDDYSSVEFFRTIFKDIRENKQAKTRYLHKLIPIQRTCVATIATINSHLESMIPAHFLDTKPTTFSILFKGRNNSSIKKEDVHTLILGTIKPMHRVCLPAPESVIIVEVIGTFCGLSIIGNYSDFNEFKMRVPKDPKDTINVAGTNEKVEVAGNGDEPVNEETQITTKEENATEIELQPTVATENETEKQIITATTPNESENAL